MRIETALNWILVSICLMIIAPAVYAFNVDGNGKLAALLVAMGLVCFGIGAVLTVMHDRHMARRTRAGRY